MEQHQSPLRGGRQLTLQQFDAYVERARAERAKAIAELGNWVIAWVAGLAFRATGCRRPEHPRGGVPVRTARQA